ncbi:MAG: vWA domain-containing protein [Candidatus Hodarchaeales archaeon]
MTKRDCINILLLLMFFITSINSCFLLNDDHKAITKATLDSSSLEPSQGLILHVEKNSSAIGPNSNIQFSINLKNNASSSLYNITATLNYPEDIIITPELSPIYSLPSIEPESSADFSFITKYISSSETNSVDVVLVIDGSGSMGEEIDSVKRELVNLTMYLVSKIPQLRMGAIVYGWSEYSEYPLSNVNNYVELTSNFNSINTFIDSLYASGGHEPWGDALYLANSWDWRPDASKLIIMVGDEDCDPGAIIGRNILEEDANGFYNGTDLLDIVSKLKDKGVVINTVICGGAGKTTINQFQWIAKYTHGNSVYLPDMENQGISLPMIIQEWTLEMRRELYKEITINITWQDYNNEIFFSTIVESFWVDFSPPSIVVSKIISPVSPGYFSVEFLVDVRDVSEISYVTLYHNAFGSWSVNYLSRIENTSLYITELTSLKKGLNISYFIESSDVLKNKAQTQDKWLIIEPKIDLPGELVTVWAEKTDTFYSYFTAPENNNYYLILKGPLEIDSIELEFVDLNFNSSLSPELTKFVNTSGSSARKIFKVTLQQNRNYSVNFTIPIDSISFSFSFVWINFLNPVNDSYHGTMTDTIRVHGVKWERPIEKFLFFKFNGTSPLTLTGEVFTSNFTFISEFSLIEATGVQPNDTYYILVWAELRTGDFTILNNDTLPPQIFDPYYTLKGNATPYTNIVFILGFLIVLVYIRKRKKFLG